MCSQSNRESNGNALGPNQTSKQAVLKLSSYLRNVPIRETTVFIYRLNPSVAKELGNNWKETPENPLQRDVLHLNFNEVVLLEQMLTFPMRSEGAGRAEPFKASRGRFLK